MTSTNSPAPPSRLAQWVSDLESIKQELFHIHHARAIWREVRDGLEANPDHSEPPYLWELMTEWYATSQSIAVRRQSYEKPGEVTLARLLKEIETASDTVTRDWYCSLYGPEQEWLDQANVTFDRFAGPGGAHVSPTWCSDLRANYTAQVEPIKAYVNRRVAHTDAREVVIPTFNDLNAAIDLLGVTLQEIHLLLKAASLMTLEPAMQFDWKKGLRTAWLLGGAGRESDLTGWWEA